MDNSTQPLFRQIASLVEDAIVDGTLGEGDRAPSTNELADFHNINPCLLYTSDAADEAYDV